MARRIDVDCVVAGGGPAGMLAGYLFARAGVRTAVLEKHGDFLRDFRGDTVHPSTLEIMDELGIGEAFLERPHQKAERLAADIAGRKLALVDFSALPVRYPFIAFMPQWHFLDFLASEAGRLPGFSLHMKTEATALIEDDEGIVGVRATAERGETEFRARLTIAADGRDSTLRRASGLRVRELGAPIDVLWFRAGHPGSGGETLLNAAHGNIVVTIDRGDYMQCALVIPKGSAEAVRQAGLEAFRATVVSAVPSLEGCLDGLESMDDVKLLTVAVDRLERWARPGLLIIGDAAHAMSPIGGVGINLAVQDAVAAANLLAERLAAGELEDSDLQLVRKRRLLPVRVIQFIQVEAQKRIFARISGRRALSKPPLALVLVSRIPFLRRLLARLIGLGFRREHVQSPDASS